MREEQNIIWPNAQAEKAKGELPLQAQSASSSKPFNEFLKWIALLVPVFLHFFIVIDIVRQPFNVNIRNNSASAVWVLFNDAVHRVGPASDFFALYHAGLNLRHDLSPYQWDEAMRKTPYYFAFRYLPISGQTLGNVFSRFSPKMAYRLWAALNEVVLITLLWMLGKRTGSWSLWWSMACLLLLSFPFFLEIHMGQFNFITLSLLAFTLLLQENWRDKAPSIRNSILGALSYMASVALKIFPLVVGPAFIRSKIHRRQYTFAFVAIFACSSIYFLSHPNDWTLFHGANITGVDFRSSFHGGNFGFLYLLFMLAGDLHIDSITHNWVLFSSLWQIGILGFTAVIVLFSRTNSVILNSALMLLAHYLSYAAIWEHHMCGAVVVGVLLFYDLSNPIQRNSSRIIPALIFISLILLVLPTPFVLFDHEMNYLLWNPSALWPVWQRYALLLSKVAPTLLLYLTALVVALKSGLAIPGKEKAVSEA